MKRSLRLNPAVLLRQPGTAERLDGSMTAEELGIEDDRVVGDIAFDLVGSSTIDGIVVSGSVSVPWETVCRRCAASVAGVSTAQVEELYQSEITDDAAFAIDGDFIDLTPVVRQYALLELPDDALCRADCAGLCASCGADRNDGDCACGETVTDPRWAALDGLVLDDVAEVEPNDTADH